MLLHAIYCTILIVMISVKESISNMRFKFVQELLKYKGNAGLHFVLHSMNKISVIVTPLCHWDIV